MIVHLSIFGGMLLKEKNNNWNFSGFVFHPKIAVSWPTTGFVAEAPNRKCFGGARLFGQVVKKVLEG